MTDLTELDDTVLKPIKATTIEKIRKAGILTVQDLAIQMPRELAEKAGMGVDTAVNAIDKALSLSRSGLVSGSDLHKEQMKRTRLSTGAKEFDKLLTTKKEWDETPRGGILSETVLEIIGEKGCHSEDTKAVTSHGFKSWEDLNVGDYVLGMVDGVVVESQILDIYEYPYDGELIEIKTNRVNLKVTPKHDVYYSKKKTDLPEKVPAMSLLNEKTWYLPCSFKPNRTDNEDFIFDVSEFIERPTLEYPQKSHPTYTNTRFSIVNLMELIGFYISDGCPLKQHHSVYPQIRHNKNQQRLIELLTIMGLKFSIYEGDKFVIFNDALGRYLLRCGEGSPNKKIPLELFSFDNKLIHLYDGLMQCDADKKKKTYYTSSKTLSEQFMVLCLFLGKQARVRKCPPRTSTLKTGRKIMGRHPSYVLSISQNPRGYIDPRKTPVRKTQYKGTVWCLSTDTENFFTFRENNITISGNSGKTQICFRLAVQAQLPLEEGGLDGEVIWIDTEGTFFASRIIEICEALGLDSDEVLSKIWVGSAVTTQDHKRLVEEASAACHEKNIKLIIVDSMMGHLRSEYVGRGMLADRQGELKQILHNLKHLCWIHKITGVYTNQVQDDPGKLYGDPLKPIGGHIMGHSPTYRVQLRRGKGPLRIVSMKKSADLPDGAARFKVTACGIEDVE